MIQKVKADLKIRLDKHGETCYYNNEPAVYPKGIEMIELPILPWMIEKAKKDAQGLGILRNSITEGDGNEAGYIGENLVIGYYQNFARVTQESSYDYDLIIENTTVDVKTKRRTVPPQAYYNASVAAANTKQACDIYMFVSILADLSKGWICGWLRKEEFFSTAVFRRKGELDPSSGSLEWKFTADCYNLELSKLKEVHRIDNSSNGSVQRNCIASNR